MKNRVERGNRARLLLFFFLNFPGIYHLLLMWHIFEIQLVFIIRSPSGSGGLEVDARRVVGFRKFRENNDGRVEWCGEKRGCAIGWR